MSSLAWAARVDSVFIVVPQFAHSYTVGMLTGCIDCFILSSVLFFEKEKGVLYRPVIRLSKKDIYQ